MLSKKEQDYIWANASLYDHDWRFWSEFMGEPYLINDCLVFYDSRVLYICGFPFQKITQELTTKHIRSILDAKRNRRALTRLSVLVAGLLLAAFVLPVSVIRPTAAAGNGPIPALAVIARRQARKFLLT